MLSGSVGLTSTNGSTSASGKLVPKPSGGQAASGSPSEMSNGFVVANVPAEAGAASASDAAVAATTAERGDLGSTESLLSPRLPRAAECAGKLTPDAPVRRRRVMAETDNRRRRARRHSDRAPPPANEPKCEPATGRYSPMSSFQISGCSAMNDPSRSAHSSESRSTTCTPDSRSHSMPPLNVRDSPTMTAPIPNWRMSPLQYQQGASVVEMVVSR